MSKRPRVRSSVPRRSGSKKRESKDSEKSNGSGRAARSRRSSGSKDASNRRSRRENPHEQSEKKTRNRTFLAIAVLTLINLYVFAGRSELDRFKLSAISFGGAKNDQPAADLDDACSGDPVRIFTGLEHYILDENQLGPQHSLRLALLQMGVDGQEIHRYEAAIQTTLDLRLLKGKNARFRVAQSHAGNLLALEIELGEGHLLQACRAGNEIRTRNLQHKARTDVALIEVELPANGGLLDAVLDAGERPELANRVADILAQDIDFMGEARPKDKVSLLIEKRYVGHNFHRYGTLLAIHYKGSAGSFRYYFDSETSLFYDYDGKPRRRSWLRSPLAWIAMNPDSRGTWEPRIEFVNGRIGALYRRPEGAPVVALGDGKIRAIGKDPDQGLVLEYQIEGGRTVRYQHLLRFLGPLEAGQKLRQGQRLALVGHSGQTPQNRLRMEILDSNGEMIDPILLRQRGSKGAPKQGKNLSHDQLKKFRKTIKSRISTLRHSKSSGN